MRPPSSIAQPIGSPTARHVVGVSAGDSGLLWQDTIESYVRALERAGPAAVAGLPWLAAVPAAVPHWQLGLCRRRDHRGPDGRTADGARLRGALQLLGLARASGHAALAGCLVLPGTDPAGRVVAVSGVPLCRRPARGMVGRVIGRERDPLWNRCGLHEDGPLWICESPEHALRLWCAGIGRIVATGGLVTPLADALDRVGSRVRHAVVVPCPLPAGDPTTSRLREVLEAREVSVTTAAADAVLDGELAVPAAVRVELPRLLAQSASGTPPAGLRRTAAASRPSSKPRRVLRTTAVPRTHPATPLTTLADAFVAWSAARGDSPRTVAHRRDHLQRFIAWADGRALGQGAPLDPATIDGYQQFLYRYRKADGAPLAWATQHGRLLGLRVFARWLIRHGHLTADPTDRLEFSRAPQRLPKRILSGSEIRRILSQCDLRPHPRRDRAIVQTLYSTGLRRAELARLCPGDVDADRGVLFVQDGKGRKDRYVPLGATAAQAIARYLADERPALAGGRELPWLFVHERGEPFSGNRLSDLVRRLIRAAGVRAGGSCHLFRHAMATHLLDGGADIRVIQAILGHAHLSTTQIYAHVSIRSLVAVHRACHPAEK